MTKDLWLMIGGVVLGGVVGWVITHLYYVRALGDMKVDAEERRRTEQLILHAIEQVGSVRYSRDAEGRIVGVSIDLRGSAAGQATASGALSVEPASGPAR